MQTMVELTVVFDNPSIPNYVRLTEKLDAEHYEDCVEQLLETARTDIPELKQEQSFFRFLTRDA